MKMNNWLLIISSILFITSCGNPHLVESGDDGLKEVEFLKVEDDAVLLNEALKIKDSKGNDVLDFGKLEINTTDKSQSMESSARIIYIENTTLEVLSLSFLFEKNTSFYFTGGAAPGINGNCAKSIGPKEKCSLEIAFEANKSGVYDDSLKVVVNNSKGSSVILFSITAEINLISSLDIKEEKSNSLISKFDLFLPLEFKTISLGSKISKEFEIKNQKNIAINLKNVELNSEHFKILNESSCQKNNPVLNHCKLVIEFNPKALGDLKAVLKVTDNEDRILSIQLTGKSIEDRDCFIQNEVSQKALIERKSPILKESLPYLTVSDKTPSRLKVIYGTDFNVQVKGVNIKTIKDAMVLSEFQTSNVNPENLDDVKVDLDIWKIINDDYKDTEIICISSKKFKKCSGKLFTLPEWLKLKNPEFFKTSKLPVNALFQEGLAKSEKSCGDKNCEVLRGEISMKELFQLNDLELKNLLAEKSFFLVIADDSRQLSLPELKIQYKKKVECQ